MQIWMNNNVSTMLKARQFKPLTIPTVIHACETWNFETDDQGRLDTFEKKITATCC